jgi:type IV pilus assembly protein PilA
MTPNPMPAPVPQKKSGISTIVIVVIVVVLACPCVVGILAAIAVPNFIKFQSKSKQSEVKANLKAAYLAQKTYFGIEGKYSDDVGEVAFSPGPGNRYLYAFAADGELARAGELDGKGKTGFEVDSTRQPASNESLEQGVPQAVWDEVGLQGTCPTDCSITIVAAGNVDNDDTVDVWTVSTKDRVIDGVPVPAGQPHQHVDDVRD